ASGNAPPGGDGRDSARAATTPSSEPTRTIVELSGPPPVTASAPPATKSVPSPTTNAARAAAASKPPVQPASPDRPDAARHRTAAGLPPQPPPIAAAKLGPTRPGSPQFGSTRGAAIAGLTKGIGGLSPTAASLLRGAANATAAAPAPSVKSAGAPNAIGAAAAAKLDAGKAAAKPDLAMPDRQRSAKVGLVSAMPAG